jgi:hypothetical protein
MVLRPEKEAEAKAIFDKWGLDFAIVGETTDDLRFRIMHGRARKSPTCRSRNWATKPRNTTGRGRRRKARSPRSRCRRTGRPRRGAAEDLIGSPNMRRAAGSGSSTTPDPGQHRCRCPAATPASCASGHDARRLPSPGRDAALCRGRPVRGRQAGGRRMLAQPDRHRRRAAGGDRQPQFRQSRTPGNHGPAGPRHRGHRRGLPALDFPIVSGNVSLYNETNGEAILPTPTIGGVGLIPD